MYERKLVNKSNQSEMSWMPPFHYESTSFSCPPPPLSPSLSPSISLLFLFFSFLSLPLSLCYRLMVVLICFNILCTTLCGSFVNFGVMTLYGDSALDNALNVFIKLLLSIPLNNLLVINTSSLLLLLIVVNCLGFSKVEYSLLHITQNTNTVSQGIY